MIVEDSINSFIKDVRLNDSKSKFALGLVTTSFNFKKPYFSFPRKIDNWGYYFHIVCPSSDSANKIITNTNNLFDEFFLDMESKKLEFCPKNIENKNPNIKFRYLYPNTITIQSCLDLISPKEKSILIFGHGNLAYYLTKHLNDRRLKKWTPSRESSSNRYLKLKELYPELESSEIDKNTSLFINLSPYYSDFYEYLEKFPNIKIIDVAGKGSIAQTIKNEIVILDISSRLVNEITYSLIGNAYKNNYGTRSDDKGEVYVSGGFRAKRGDIIVDNFTKPSYMIGISDGNGGFQKRLNKKIN